MDSESVPLSLAPIAPILRVANKIRKENPRVAYLCKSQENKIQSFFLVIYYSYYQIL